VRRRTRLFPTDAVSSPARRSEARPPFTPTIMLIWRSLQIASAVNAKQRLILAVTALHDAIGVKAGAWSDTVKIGWTHMQGATPLTLGQEWSGYAGMLTDDLARKDRACITISRLSLQCYNWALSAGPNSTAPWTKKDGKALCSDRHLAGGARGPSRIRLCARC
jgi:fumarate hydratase class II